VASLLVRCPAKINRFLKIGPLDDRGYHSLETEFQAIGLCDDLILTPGGSGFTIEGPESSGLDPSDRNNTVLKALRLMHEVATLPALGIRLVKRIPNQAGLGGGSSDAAGLLRGLRQILPPTVPQRDFEMVARGVGADVSFFLVGGRAYGEGYGERLSALPDLEVSEPMVIAMPTARCSTPEMYRALDLKRGEANDLGEDEVNSFHAVAPQPCMEAMQVMGELGLESPALAGSGAAVFGFAQNESQANEVAQKLKNQGLQTWVTSTLTRSESLAFERIDS
jgi:4-diphosphocytidyl-2-C-methyl-D-erythritol kinase